MSHRRVQKILNAYLDGELREEEKRLVEEHLKECEECSKELEALKTVDRMARTSLAPEPSEDYWKTLPGRVRTRIIAEEESREPRLRRFFVLRPARLKLAATIAVVALVVLVGRHYLMEEGPGAMRFGRLTKDQLPSEAPTEDFKVPELRVEGAAQPPGEGKGKVAEVTKGEVELAGERAKPVRRPPTPEAAVPPPSREPVAEERVPSEEEADFYGYEEVRGDKPGVSAKKKAGAPEKEGRLSGSARFELALSQQDKGDYDEAVRNYARVMAEDKKLAPSAQFQMNLIQAAVRDTGSDEGPLRRKTEMWQSFVDRYPESDLLPEACRNLADNAYELSRLTQRKDDIEQAIAAVKRSLDFVKEERTAEYRTRARQIDDLQRDLERVR